jgi:C4-dicarboxylate-specific signal transduction histidine kinase
VIGNAFDAVNEVIDPHVWISARPAPDRSGVEVRIRDSGPGIDDACRERIFEAFFTTKSRASGLGLGLAITKEIVEGHAGTIHVSHPCDGGAEFVIRLPFASL